MIEKMSTFITGKMLLSGVICEDDKEIYVYGIDIMLSTLITCVLVFLLGLLTFGIHLSLFYLLTTAPLRRFGGGWHANTHYMCALVQCLVFLLVSIIAIAIVEHVSIWMLIIVQAVCYFVICVKAPAEHPDNPILVQRMMLFSKCVIRA